MKLKLLTISLLLLLTCTACSKEPNNTTTSTTPDTQAVAETTEPAKQSATKNTDNATPTPEQETTTPADNQDTASNSNAAIPQDPYVMEVPPFAYYTANQANTTEASSITLEVSSSESNDITDTDKWFEENNLTLNQYQIRDLASTDLPSGVDTSYQDLILTNAFHDDAYIYCLYGTNYSDSYLLSIYDLKSNEVLYTIDFSNYMYASLANGQKLGSSQQLTWASIKDGILYVSNCHKTYASTTNYQNAYLTAIDLKDMHVVWRSDALVSNSENFLVLDNVILSGYGFTDENDYIYALDRSTGTVIASIPLKSAPSYLVQKDNQLFVRTYNMNYVFNVVTK